MELKDYLEKYKSATSIKDFDFIESEAEKKKKVLKQMIFRLNEDRIKSGRKKLSDAFYCIKLAESGMKTSADLYWFHKYCEEAKNYGSCWWWSLKSQEEKNV
jgi:hypothetical protein